jgi:hypothetical protein
VAVEELLTLELALHKALAVLVEVVTEVQQLESVEQLILVQAVAELVLVTVAQVVQA